MKQILKSLILLAIVTSNAASAAREQSEFNRSDTLSVAVVNFGHLHRLAKVAADAIAQQVSLQERLNLIDREQTNTAARGIGYNGSLNMTLEEARNLGLAIGCNYMVIGDAQTIRRSPATNEFYFEAYASFFLVSTRTGRLLYWERPAFTAQTSEIAESQLLNELKSSGAKLASIIHATDESERESILLSLASDTPMMTDVDDVASSERAGYRAPQPYQRRRPIYPETAARAEAEATIDVLVELDARGEVGKIDIIKWAGFGLDESTLATVRSLHFRPAMQDGKPFATRILLRYNFRKPIR